MPKRPRQHQLEDESRTAFRAALPATWVFRDSVPDYGIDGEVEIFDNAGLGTGRLFLVQLKATDEPDLDRALTMRFRLDTYRYYKSLDLPVLIVRYHAPTRKLYVKWFHTLDPYYGKRGEKTIAFRLTAEDEWHGGTAARLVLDLEAVRQLRSPQMPLPVSFTLTLKEPEIHGVPAAQIALEIRKAVARLPGIIVISGTPPAHAHPSIVIGNDKTVVDLAGVTSFTLHTSRGYPVELVLSKFPSDVLIGVAIALDVAGHSDIAARLAAEYGPSSSVITHPQVAMRVARCMSRAHRVSEALRLSEMLLENEEALDTVQFLMLPALLHGDSLSGSERGYYRRLLQKRIERAEQSEHKRGAGTAHYNLGNHLRRSPHGGVALHHYRKAAEYDPGYLERGYFWRELAGVLFESRRYRLAARFYERAISLGEEGLCCALHADALMFAGRYRESQETFEAYLASARDSASEWRLKAVVLRVLRRVIGSDEQERRTSAAIALANPDVASSPNEQRRQLEDALKHDALCGPALFNLGVLESQTENQGGAFIWFLAAALTQRGDIEAWCNAMALAIFLKEYNLLVPHIIHAAYFANREEFSEQVVGFARSQPEGFPVTEFVNAIDAFLSHYSREREPVVMRLLGEGSEFSVIDLRPSVIPKKEGEGS